MLAHAHTHTHMHTHTHNENKTKMKQGQYESKEKGEGGRRKGGEGGVRGCWEVTEVFFIPSWSPLLVFIWGLLNSACAKRVSLEFISARLMTLGEGRLFLDLPFLISLASFWLL